MEGYRCAICNRTMGASSETAECIFCGQREPADYLCENHHYICEDCRISAAEDVIRKHCKHTKEKDPIKISELLMKHPAIQMHGPEHHYLVSGVLLASMRNNRILDISPSLVDKAIERAKQAPSEACASWGACGAAIGAGITFSIAMKANIMSGEKRKFVLNLVAKILREIGKLEGPRCCKLSTFTALKEAKKKLREKYNIKFEKRVIQCDFADSNKDCLKEKCPYYHIN